AADSGGSRRTIPRPIQSGAERSTPDCSVGGSRQRSLTGDKSVVVRRTGGEEKPVDRAAATWSGIWRSVCPRVEQECSLRDRVTLRENPDHVLPSSSLDCVPISRRQPAGPALRSRLRNRKRQQAAAVQGPQGHIVVSGGNVNADP